MFDLFLPPRAALAALCDITAVYFWETDILSLLFCSMAVMTVENEDPFR
jgi:hypothetical protein